MRRLILYFTIVWPFLWENARMRAEYVGYDTYNLFHIVPFTRDSKYFEIGFIVVSLIFAAAYHWVKKRRIQSSFVTKACLGILVISVLSGFLNGTPIMGILQITYIFVSPLLIFFLFSNLDFSIDKCRVIFHWLICFAVIDIVAALYQVVIMGNRFDFVVGFAWDAHILACYFFIILFFLVAYVAVKRKYFVVVLVPGLLVPAIFASNQKADLTALIVMGLSYLLVSRRSFSRKLSFCIPMITLIVGSYFAMTQLDPEFLERDTYVAENLGNVAILQGYWELPGNLVRKPTSLLIGYGPGLYSSKSYFDVSQGEGYFGRDVGVSTLGQGGAWAVSYSLFVLIGGEIGAIGLGLFVSVFVWLFMILLRLFRRTRDCDVKWKSLGLTLYLVFLAMICGESPYGGWISSSLTWPFFAMMGILYQNDLGSGNGLSKTKTTENGHSKCSRVGARSLTY